MPKGKGKKKTNINFRQSSSEKAASAPYRDFGKRQVYRRKSF